MAHGSEVLACPAQVLAFKSRLLRDAARMSKLKRKLRKAKAVCRKAAASGAPPCCGSFRLDSRQPASRPSGESNPLVSRLASNSPAVEQVAREYLLTLTMCNTMCKMSYPDRFMFRSCISNMFLSLAAKPHIAKTSITLLVNADARSARYPIFALTNHVICYQHLFHPPM